MNSLSHIERTASLRHMSEQGVEILVVGGGITGAGVALEAAVRGYPTGLVEKSDFASATSSKSTKLVHGGIRYLPQFDIALVREGLEERGRLVRNAPHLVRPLGFVLPLYKDARRPLGTPIVPPFGIGMSYVLMAGLLAYDILAGKLSLGRFKRLGAQRGLELAPCLNSEGLTNAFLYYDGQSDDTLLTSTVLRTAAEKGAHLANYTEVIGFEQTHGRISAALVHDHVGGGTYTIPVGTVVNAAGVFAERIELLVEGTSTIEITPAKGTHLTVTREVLDIRTDAIVLPETDDGRLLFIVPWGNRVTIGTTDTQGGDLDDPRATEADIEYLLRHVNRYMRCKLTRDDIISAWAGYRPLVSKRGAGASSKLSRTHVVLDSPGGMVSIVGGKLTSYRRMAEDTMNHIGGKLGKPKTQVTRDLPLVGSDHWQASVQRLKEAAPGYGLQADTVERLANYGSEVEVMLGWLADDRSLAERVTPELPYVMAEVVFACRYEMALQLADVLERRLHLNFEDRSRGVDAAPAVARLMAKELHWNEAEVEQQVAGYRVLVEQQAVVS